MSAESFEYAVVGGGIQGLSAAYELAKIGRSVVLLEERYLGSGSTGRGFGGIRTLHGDESYVRVAVKSMSMWRKLSQELRYNLMLRKAGYLFLLYTREEEERMEENIKMARRYGVKARFIDPSELNTPYLDLSEVAAVVEHPEALVALPFSVVWGYWRGISRLGGAVKTWEKVVDIEVDGGFKLKTTRGAYRADVVIIAAGSGSIELLKKLGVELPLAVVKKEAVVTESLKPFLKPLIVTPKIAVVQSARGEVLADYYAEDIPTTPEDLSATHYMASFVAKYLIKLIPKLALVNVIRQWAGHYVSTPDLKPAIGDVGENLWVSVGWRSGGFMMGPAVGKLLAESAVRGKLLSELESFSPYRFKR
ncbi:MAG: FAD-binding oxidoreductase [Thermoproteota archaeon]|nr:MAG: FAD-binding oxidoreductase [Candidatus Korarchaeota archaeon]